MVDPYFEKSVFDPYFEKTVLKQPSVSVPFTESNQKQPSVSVPVTESSSDHAFGNVKHFRKEDDHSFSAAQVVLLQKLSMLKDKLLEGKEEEFLRKLGLGTEKVTETIEQHKWARIADLSYNIGYNDIKGAEDIIAKGAEYIPNFDDYEILHDMSTKDYTVLRNKTSGDVVMSFRGSDTGFFNKQTLLENPERIKNVEDWWVNYHTLKGNPEVTRRYKDSTEAVLRIAKALGVEPSEIYFTGHSNGGGNARRQAEIFGAKAYVFNAADNPFKDMTVKGVKEGTKVTAWRTVGDIIVSIGSKINTPDHMDVKELTAKIGTETDLIKQHGMDQFHHDDPVIVEGEIENMRTSKVRNFVGSTAGVAEVAGSSVLALAFSELFAPVYKDPKEEAKAQAFLIADAPKAALSWTDPSWTLIQFMDLMGLGLTPNETKKVRDLLGIKEHTAPESKPAPVIRWLQKLTGRAKQDAELQEDKDLAAEMGMTLSEYLTTSKLHGWEPIPTSTKEVSASTVDLMKIYDIDYGKPPGKIENEGRDDDGIATFTRGGKTYKEIP